VIEHGSVRHLDLTVGGVAVELSANPASRTIAPWKDGFTAASTGRLALHSSAGTSRCLGHRWASSGRPTPSRVAGAQTARMHGRLKVGSGTSAPRRRSASRIWFVRSASTVCGRTTTARCIDAGADEEARGMGSQFCRSCVCGVDPLEGTRAQKRTPTCAAGPAMSTTRSSERVAEAKERASSRIASYMIACVHSQRKRGPIW
jgi:hypothetical protein